ncbi:protein cholesin [Amia ocellicauda]|uniref:protein cholesin n=1 Tax=Amia ocellicauda TaxID=2972642 RepID=UPI003463AECC
MAKSKRCEETGHSKSKRRRTQDTEERHEIEERPETKTKNRKKMGPQGPDSVTEPDKKASDTEVDGGKRKKSKKQRDGGEREDVVVEKKKKKKEKKSMKGFEHVLLLWMPPEIHCCLAMPSIEPEVRVTEDEEEEEKELEEEEELSPEEMRVLERKMKKERKKEEKRKLKESGMSVKKTEPAKPTAAQLALDYLNCWSEDRAAWKFQKTRQTWLLQHMYDREKVPDESFAVLLEYLEGLQGAARDATVEQAEKLVREQDGAADASRRGREVVQLLS